MKATILKNDNLRVELDAILPNGRDVDVRIEIEGRTVYLESTIITESDEDKEAWERFMRAKRLNENVEMGRPGEFDKANAKSPSPYYDCVRFYAKAYDKVALQLDPEKGQVSGQDPNVLLVSFYSPRAPLSPQSLGVGWALDELFADQPKTGVRLKDEAPHGRIDISLLGWLDFAAQDLIAQSRRTREEYQRRYTEIVAAPRKLGAVMLFEGHSPEASRLNYNASSTCRLSHSLMARLEELFCGTTLRSVSSRS